MQLKSNEESVKVIREKLKLAAKEKDKTGGKSEPSEKSKSKFG